MTKIKIISGGQSGADLGGLCAAKKVVDKDGNPIETGGWMPVDYMTEDGPRPEYADRFRVREMPGLGWSLAKQYRRRAEMNVRESDATICFDLTLSRATDNAYFDADKHGKGFRCVMLERGEDGEIRPCVAAHTVKNIVEWIAENDFKVINIAGNRESRAPGIGAWVEACMVEVFKALGYEEIKS